jgi:hypothetical protein
MPIHGAYLAVRAETLLILILALMIVQILLVRQCMQVVLRNQAVVMDVNTKIQVRNGMSMQIHRLHCGALVTFAIGNGQQVGVFHGHFAIILPIKIVLQ